MSDRLVCLAVAVPGALGVEVDALRFRVDPSRRHMPAHITLIPPTRHADHEAVRARLAAACAASEPVAVRVGGVGTFRPRSPVVYVSVPGGAAELGALAARLRAAAGLEPEGRPYVPHVTVANRVPEEALDLAAAGAASVAGEFTAVEVTWFEHGAEGWAAAHALPLLGRGPAPAVADALARLGLAHRVIAHTEPVTSLEQAAAARGVELADVVKTLVVRRGADDYVLVLVPGGRSLSWPKLRAHLGVSRLSMPPAEEALAATGFERGTITPLGTTRGWPVVADAVIATRGEVTLGSGAHDVAIGVDAGALLAAVGAVVADVTDPE